MTTSFSTEYIHTCLLLRQTWVVTYNSSWEEIKQRSTRSFSATEMLGHDRLEGKEKSPFAKYFSCIPFSLFDKQSNPDIPIIIDWVSKYARYTSCVFFQWNQGMTRIWTDILSCIHFSDAMNPPSNYQDRIFNPSLRVRQLFLSWEEEAIKQKPLTLASTQHICITKRHTHTHHGDQHARNCMMSDIMYRHTPFDPNSLHFSLKKCTTHTCLHAKHVGLNFKSVLVLRSLVLVVWVLTFQDWE